MKYKYMFDSEPHYQLNIVKDEERSWKSQPKKIIIFNSTTEHQNYESIVININ